MHFPLAGRHIVKRISSRHNLADCYAGIATVISFQSTFCSQANLISGIEIKDVVIDIWEEFTESQNATRLLVVSLLS